MKFTVYSKENGMVLFSGEGDDPMALENETRAVLLDEKKDGGWISSDGQHHDVPQRPGPDYEWDWATKEWVSKNSIEDYRQIAIANINKERSLRLTAPVDYQGHWVDAHTTAMGNITAKIAELNALAELGVEPGVESLSWRNADNQNVWFATSAEMKAWLLGLVVAVSQRTSEIYSWSWVEKEKIRSTTSKEELEALGWLK